MTSSRKQLIALLKPYRLRIVLLLLLATGSNLLNLYLPQLFQRGIDDYSAGQLQSDKLLTAFLSVTLFIFCFATLQNVLQALLAETAARDLRQQLADSISEQSYARLQSHGSERILTHLTSDIDAIKLFISQALVSILSAVVLLLGAATLLLRTHFWLATSVLLTLPLIGGLFFYVFSRIRKLFRQAQAAIDRLNRIINQSILGAALVRVLDSATAEVEKFKEANATARELGLLILKHFAALIPWVGFIAGVGNLILLLLGGHYVIRGDLSLGQFTAFNTYLAMLIFPLMILGFMSNLIARSAAAYGRIAPLLYASPDLQEGGLTELEHATLRCENLSIMLQQKPVLKGVQLEIPAGQRTGIIGPTAAGKSTLLHLILKYPQQR